MTDPKRADPRVELIEKTTPYQGYFKIEVYRVRHERFGGGWTDEMRREVFERGHAATVLPYDPARDAVVLLEQFRIGAFAAGTDPWLIEVVAGIVEPGESPADVVRREAIEEAGCAIGALEPIGEILPTPGGSSEILYMFCGRCDSDGLGGLHGLDHEHEDIRAFVVPADEALDMLAAGRVRNGNAVISLQWLALNRERLRRLWA